MRIHFKILLLLIISCCSISSKAGTPTAYINFAAFSTPAGKNYFETYISIAGNSLHYIKTANNKFVATAHITLYFKSGDSVVSSANFNVHSPELNDTSVKSDFMDVHRFFLKKGNYTLIFTLDDPNDASHAVTSIKHLIHTGYSHDTVSISDAEFLSSYSASDKEGPYNKYGYQMVPFVYDNYTPNIKKLNFYLELYNTEKFAGPGKNSN